jgi:hypothetical protein
MEVQVENDGRYWILRLLPFSVITAIVGRNGEGLQHTLL